MSAPSVEVLFQATDAACFKVAGGKRELYARGVLSVLRHTSGDNGVAFVMVQRFQYPLRADIPVLKAAPRTYMFTCPGQVFYGIILPESVTQDQVFSFEELLGSEADLHMAESAPEEEEEEEEEVTYPSVPPVIPTTPAKSPQRQQSKDIDPNATDTIGTEENAASQIDGEASGSNTALKITKVESKIEIYSQLTTRGLLSGARLIGSTVKKGGKFIISKVPPNQTPTKVSKYTTSIIRFAKSSYVNSIKDKLNTVIETGVDMVSSTFNFSLAKALADTEYGKKIVNYENPTLNAAKSAASTTMTAIDNVLLAAFEASNIILTDLGDATCDIVEHRYGKEVGDTSKEVFSLTTDLVEVTRNAYRTGVSSLATAIVGEESDNSEEQEQEQEQEQKQEEADKIAMKSDGDALNDSTQMICTADSIDSPSSNDKPVGDESNDTQVSRQNDATSTPSLASGSNGTGQTLNVTTHAPMEISESVTKE